MEEKGSDILLVVDDQEVFQGAIRFEQINQGDEGKVSDLMDRDIPVVKADGEIRATLEVMFKQKAVWLPVVDDEKRLKGIVTMTHFSCFFAAEGQIQEGAS
jgi:osmoprotectant transport system ATP-binding protein